MKSVMLLIWVISTVDRDQKIGKLSCCASNQKISNLPATIHLTWAINSTFDLSTYIKSIIFSSGICLLFLKSQDSCGSLHWW